MAINPMQRRTRNSFLIGILLGLVATIGVAVIMSAQINNLSSEVDSLKSKTNIVFVTNKYMESGAVITVDDLVAEEVQTSLDINEMVGLSDLESEYDDSGKPILKEYILKVNVPAGVILTKDMIESTEEKFSDSIRLQEYNMIILPTLLKNGDYIDIRLKLASGVDYIVLSKKQVQSCTSDTVWLKMSEEDILVLGNAIVEAYIMNGSKLYATVYTEAGRQKAASPTYVVSSTVAQLIHNDDNIVNTAKNELIERYNTNQVQVREQAINPSINKNEDTNESTVEAGVKEEISKIKEARTEYVESLMGTGMIGIDD